MYTLTVFDGIDQLTTITADTVAEAFEKAAALRAQDFRVIF